MALVSDMVFSLLILASGVFAASTLGFAVAWVRARERAIRAEQRDGALPDERASRLDHLEQAMESVVGEVEQVAEGQRFMSQLLARRAEQPRGGDVQPVRG